MERRSIIEACNKLLFVCEAHCSPGLRPSRIDSTAERFRVARRTRICPRNLQSGDGDHHEGESPTQAASPFIASPIYQHHVTSHSACPTRLLEIKTSVARLGLHFEVVGGFPQFHLASIVLQDVFRGPSRHNGS